MKEQLKKQADKIVKLSQLKNMAYVIAKYNILCRGYYTYMEVDENGKNGLKVFVEEF